jgi:DnaJ-class molecular chaperone
MKRLIKATAEKECSACGGTGFPPTKQPAQPGRRIYPAPCEKCGGKGRITKVSNAHAESIS